jgi:hypothetical protein
MRIKLGIALICTLSTCNNPKPASVHEPTGQPNKIAQASWLLGTWSSHFAERSNFETWTKFNDSTYLGRSYSIRKGDTVSSESIKLIQQGKSIHYIPTVQGQNNDTPVMFTLTSSDSKTLVFENPAHDFPQRIVYKTAPPDSLIAEISGLVNGEIRAQKFSMRREE